MFILRARLLHTWRCRAIANSENARYFVPRSRPTYRRINLRACADSWDTVLKSQPVSRYEIYVIRAITRDNRLSMRARSLARVIIALLVLIATIPALPPAT